MITESLPSWTSIPDGIEPNPATKLQMRDDLVARVKADQPDPCVQEALTFAADEFFTSDEAGLFARDPAATSSAVRDLETRGSLKISCRKCKKFIDKVIGAIVSSPVLTPVVCGQIAAEVSAATRQRKWLEAKGKVQNLRVSVGGGSGIRRPMPMVS